MRWIITNKVSNNSPKVAIFAGYPAALDGLTVLEGVSASMGPGAERDRP